MRRTLFTIFIIFFMCAPVDQVSALMKSRVKYENTGNVIWEVKTDEKIVALTFDDGPHPQYTPEILDILAKNKAKATFFVMGAHAKKYSYLIDRQVSEGHEIGNHTFNHIYNINSTSQLKEELEKTSYTIKQITGSEPTLYRPVAGVYNDLIVNTAVENGYQVIMWSWHQDPRDWSTPGVNKIVNHIISDVRPGDIILLHDAGGNRSQTVQALDEILTVFKKEGYRSVTVSELISSSKNKPINPDLDPIMK